MFEEFKKFAMRGSVVDLAIGVIIGMTVAQALHVCGTESNRPNLLYTPMRGDYVSPPER